MTRTVLGRLKSRKNVKWDVTDWSELGVSDAIGKLAGPKVRLRQFGISLSKIKD